MHCMMTLIGVEDIHHIEDPKAKKEKVEQFGESYINAKKMIKKETGLEATLWFYFEGEA